MDMIFNNIEAEEFSSLRDRSGMSPRSVETAKIALKNTLFMVGIRNKEGRLIAFGRVVGDGGTTFVVSDIMVDKSYQKQGLGKQIMSQVDNYLNSIANESGYICLIADKPADKLYEKFGFEYLDEETAVGMYRPYK